jgi:hypothetical protein
VLEAALLSLAGDIFRQLPGMVFKVMEEAEEDLTKAAETIDKADAKLAAEAKQACHTSENAGAPADVAAIAAGGAGALPGRPPLQLEPGNTGGPTLRDLMNWRSRPTQERAGAYPGEKRWRAGERHVANMWDGQHQGNHIPVPTHDNAPYPVTGPGGRDVDVVHVGPDGRKYHIEVKTYQRWKTVNGVSQEQYVPLSEDLREQIAKDVNIRAADPAVELHWTFTDAHPSPELRNALSHARITFTTMN